mmetsp:Transcript_5449/g.12540  ORF Transcript_5449/g.12540 Transcript_5449/m.12540 type:complete len:273 (+) Transcript_5449:554-1372(+)
MCLRRGHRTAAAPVVVVTCSGQCTRLVCEPPPRGRHPHPYRGSSSTKSFLIRHQRHPAQGSHSRSSRSKATTTATSTITCFLHCFWARLTTTRRRKKEEDPISSSIMNCSSSSNSSSSSSNNNNNSKTEDQCRSTVSTKRKCAAALRRWDHAAMVRSVNLRMDLQSCVRWHVIHGTRRRSVERSPSTAPVRTEGDAVSFTHLPRARLSRILLPRSVQRRTWKIQQPLLASPARSRRRRRWWCRRPRCRSSSQHRLLLPPIPSHLCAAHRCQQ